MTDDQFKVVVGEMIKAGFDDLREEMRQLFVPLADLPKLMADALRDYAKSHDMDVLTKRVASDEGDIQRNTQDIQAIRGEVADQQNMLVTILNEMTAIKQGQGEIVTKVSHDLVTVKSMIEPLRFVDQKQGERLDAQSERIEALAALQAEGNRKLGDLQADTTAMRHDFDDQRVRYAEAITPITLTTRRQEERIAELEGHAGELVARARAEDARRQRLRDMIMSRAGAAAAGVMIPAALSAFSNIDVGRLGELFVYILGGG